MDDPVDGSLIENVKENIVPSRDGRSAQAISQLYSVPRAQRAKELSATHSHYRELINAIPADAPLPDVQPDDELEARDPLAFYCQYVGWIMDNYPEGSSTESGLLTVLEEATRRFCGKEVYKDDERYIKLWIEYANLVEQSERVFAFMLANDIGSVFPTPYEEFAVILERNKHFTKADGIYRLAIARKVKNYEILKAKYKEFQARRAAAAALAASSPPPPDAPPPTNTSTPATLTSPPRATLAQPVRAPLGARTVLGGLGTRNGPSARTPSQTLTQPPRAPLGASSSSSLTTTSQTRSGGLGLRSASSSTRAPGLSLAAGGSGPTPGRSNAGKVSVFVDGPPDPTLATAAPDVEVGAWPKLDTRAESIKENTAIATDGTIKQKVEKRVGPKMEIFRDETAGAATSNVDREAIDQVFRQKQITAQEAASLSRDPLRNFSAHFARDVDVPAV